MHEYDKCSKWLLQHHGDSILRLARRALPEVVVLFLHRNGRVEAAGSAELRSHRGLTSWSVGWRAIRLREVPAADLLAAGDGGLIPWVPLTKIDGPPEPVFREFRDRIQRDAPEIERDPMLAVTHFLAGPKYNNRRLFELLAGRQAMIESKSPFVQELRREAVTDVIIEVLVNRFGPEAGELRVDLGLVEDATRLTELTKLAVTCTDLDAFRNHLSS